MPRVANKCVSKVELEEASIRQYTITELLSNIFDILSMIKPILEISNEGSILLTLSNLSNDQLANCSKYSKIDRMNVSKTSMLVMTLFTILLSNNNQILHFVLYGYFDICI